MTLKPALAMAFSPSALVTRYLTFTATTGSFARAFQSGGAFKVSGSSNMRCFGLASFLAFSF